MRGKVDNVLLIVTLCLLLIGAVMIYSSTSVITPLTAKKNITPFYYFKRHLFTMLVGFFFMFMVYKLEPEFLGRLSIPLLIFSFLLLLAVFIPTVGLTVGGARRWIRSWPSTFQPSELAKLAMVIFLARYVSMPYFRKDSFISFLIPVVVMAMFQLVFLMQPDFGATINLGILTITILILAGTRLRYVMSLIVLAIPIAIKLAMEPYRLKRILAFLDPWSDPQGSGFQLIQSLIALGSGGLTGVGLGDGKQKLSFLPEIHTDFIFSLIGEELGFIGTMVVISMFIIIYIRGISISGKAYTGFGYYLSYGLTIMIVLQALINFAVITGVVPTKGLPLPFISYGGSSLLVNMVAIGILLNISKGGDCIKMKEAKDVIMEKKKALLSVYGRGVRESQKDQGVETQVRPDHVRWGSKSVL